MITLIQKSLAASNLFGISPKLSRGSTNSNIPISLGIPSVTLAWGGKGGKAHSLGEWWINEDGHKAIQLALLILLLGLLKKGPPDAVKYILEIIL